MRVLVCGGRDFSDYALMDAVLFGFLDMYGITTIIHGNARGADRLAGEWADRHKIPKLVFDADWKSYGLAAGPIRNQRMLDEGKPDHVFGFKGGRGTADMLRRAEDAGISWERIA